MPLWTDHILQPGPPVDLALHNYTIFQNAIGLVLIPWLGLVGAFNATWIAMQALSGLGVFLLARRRTDSDTSAFLAGALFAFSPTMIARSTAHQSLVAAAPLAFFLLFVLRAADRRGVADAALAGACAAWAGVCDAYYGVYCVLLLGVVVAVRSLRRERLEPPRGGPAPGRVVSALMILPAVAIVIILATGGGRVDVFGVAVRATTLYTPTLILTLLAVARLSIALWRRGRWRVDGVLDRRRLAQIAAGTAACAILLAPLLGAAVQRLRWEGGIQERVLWRSSPPGVDLLWFVTPNPNHPLAPAALRRFVTTRPDSYPENVASIPCVALIVIGIAARRRPRPVLPIALVAVFGLLALGPFITLGHFNTTVPGPWAFLRYLPIVGAARTPTRFAIPMLLGIALLFAWAMDRVARRRVIVAIVAAALAFELLPVPRLTASALVPGVYDTIGADPDDVTVLEVPFGVWDGTSQTGFANIASMYFQTRHQKRVLGGYLSRLPRRRVREQMSYPTLRLIAHMSDGRPVEPNLADAAREDASYFLERTRLRYVVIDPRLASPELRAKAIELLGLKLVRAADGLELYRTGS